MLVHTFFFFLELIFARCRLRDLRAKSQQVSDLDDEAVNCSALIDHSNMIVVKNISNNSDTRFKQQLLPAWQPVLTPWTVIIILGVIGVAFIALGSSLLDASNSVVEEQYQYDGKGAASDECEIKSANEGKSCTISITVSETMKSPIFVYYQLSNFYQNHRQYVKSYSYEQLLGNYKLDKDELRDLGCSSLVQNGSKTLNPCGLIANSLFNDRITVKTADFSPMYTSNIAWETDVKKKYEQPGHGASFGDLSKAFLRAEVTDSAEVTELKNTCINGPCSDYICEKYLEGWEKDDDTSCKGYYCGTADGEAYSSDLANFFNCESGSTHVYWYPDQDKMQYLYETFPEVISPLHGVKSPLFAVWMRTAALPKFRKLYGKIGVDIKKGQTIEFDVVNNFAVKDFRGTKSLIITTTTWIGGKNAFLGQAFVTVGSLCLACSFAFLGKNQWRPRKVGDTTLLN